MISILFDTNIYDYLAKDPQICESIKQLVSYGKIKVLITRTVAEELYQPPFNGIPNLFPVEYIGNTVSRVGIMCAGDSLGSGDDFYEHLGQSTKINDALIADAASYYADWLVTEDRRLRKRASTSSARFTAMNYKGFIREFQAILTKNITLNS